VGSSGAGEHPVMLIAAALELAERAFRVLAILLSTSAPDL
jgi:hypothetical protein